MCRPLPRLRQSPTARAFVQNPYPFYEKARAAGPLVFWEDYGLPCAVSFAAISQIMKDRRCGREPPEEARTPCPAHLRPFQRIEDHSMLELEPPRHTRLRGLVLRAFTSRRIAALGPGIGALAHGLIGALPPGRFDLLPGFAQKLPVIVIARLLGVPEAMAPDLLRWSNAMVAMYQAGRDHATEMAAASASAEFTAFLLGYVEERRARPADDLITHLIAAEEDGARLSSDELVATCILLLNAGHEATVHTLGNGVKALLENRISPEALAPESIAATVEEVLRHDPPLHMFTRWVYEDIEVMGHRFARGDRIGCLLAAGNRDPGPWDRPARFDPGRPVRTHLAFGAGVHFCVGAPLARLELQVALPILFERLPGLRLSGQPRYGDTYHFRGLDALWLERD